MGRSSSKSSSSNSTVNNAYALQGDNTGVSVMGEGNTLTMTDHGAVNAAFDLGKQSLFTADAAVTGALAFGEGAIDKSLGSVSDLAMQMNEATAKQTKQSTDAITKLAENMQTDGQAALMANNTKVVFGVVGAFAFIVIVLALAAMSKGN